MSILPGRPGHPRRYHNVMMVELVKELFVDDGVIVHVCVCMAGLLKLFHPAIPDACFPIVYEHVHIHTC